MKNFYKRFLLVHLLVTFMLFVTWLAGESIKGHSGPMSAVYYVLHIFPGSVIFMLITFEWLVRNQGKLIRTQGMPLYLWINRNLHRAYYLILLALPLTGILVFFDFVEARPFYKIHSTLFNLLMLLITINLASMALGSFSGKNSPTSASDNDLGCFWVVRIPNIFSGNSFDTHLKRFVNGTYWNFGRNKWLLFQVTIYPEWNDALRGDLSLI